MIIGPCQISVVLCQMQFLFQTSSFKYLHWCGVGLYSIYNNNKEYISDIEYIWNVFDIGYILFAHILKPDNVVGVGSAGDSAVQINIAPLPEIGFANGCFNNGW